MTVRARELFESPATQPPDALPAGEKRARGAYFTPSPLALAICRTLYAEACVRPRTILEPGCGGGAFLRAAAATWPPAKLHGVDLVPACEGPGLVEQRDLFTVTDRFDLVLGNPDFGIAERVVRHCLGLLNPGGHLAFLLRITFEASAARVPLFADHPLRFRSVIPQRPSFTGGGTDPCDYALLVWQRGWLGRGELLPPVLWR